MSSIQYCNLCKRQVTPKSAKWGGGDLVLILLTLGFWIFPKLLLSRSSNRCPICNTKTTATVSLNSQSMNMMSPENAMAIPSPYPQHPQLATHKTSASRILLLTGSAFFFLVIIGVVVAVIANIGNSQSAALSKDIKQDIDKKAAHQRFEAEIAKEKEAIKNHKVYVGMDADAAERSWGKPRSINRTTTGNSTHEQWVYGGHSNLYFVDGKLTSIQN